MALDIVALALAKKGGGGGGGVKEVYVESSTPTIIAEANTRYVCDEVTTISITPTQTGVTDVVFASGATPTALTVPATVLFPAWFDPTDLYSNVIYEISIMDGIFGAVAMWTRPHYEEEEPST